MEIEFEEYVELEKVLASRQVVEVRHGGKHEIFGLEVIAYSPVVQWKRKAMENVP